MSVQLDELRALVAKMRAFADECQEVIDYPDSEHELGWFHGRQNLARDYANELEVALAHVAVPVAPEPWLFAISEPSGAWHDGENCVFGDCQSAQDEVYLLNGDLQDDEPEFNVVPLYRAVPSAEQPTQPNSEAWTAVEAVIMRMEKEANVRAAPPRMEGGCVSTLRFWAIELRAALAQSNAGATPAIGDAKEGTR